MAKNRITTSQDHSDWPISLHNSDKIRLDQCVQKAESTVQVVEKKSNLLNRKISLLVCKFKPN